VPSNIYISPEEVQKAEKMHERINGSGDGKNGK